MPTLGITCKAGADGISISVKYFCAKVPSHFFRQHKATLPPMDFNFYWLPERNETTEPPRIPPSIKDWLTLKEMNKRVG